LHHAGAVGVGLFVDRRLLREVAHQRPDAIVVNQGEFLGRRAIRGLSKIAPVANYTNDDPFGGRDGRRFDRYLRALPEYDAVAVVREPNVTEAITAGATNVVRVFMSADEVAHGSIGVPSSLTEEYKSEVLFVGTWMPERGPFLLELVRRGVPLSIRGDRWDRAPEWSELKRFWRGPGIYTDEEYAAAIRGARVSLGLLSVGNRDEHTTRSVEIPLLGGVLCAQRTPEHQSMYLEGVEADFWSDADECAAKCLALLSDPDRRARMASAGRSRASQSPHLNERVMARVLAALDQASPSQAVHQ
jgi:hypothetical protein